MNPLKIEATKKIAKSLAAFAVLFLGLAAIFFTPKIFSAPPTQDCSAVPGGTTPQAGDNCLYFYPLPLCQAVPSASWIIPASSILSAGTTANHRVNCADLADLPLCNQLTDNAVTAYPLKNCVNECSDPSFTDPDPSHIPAYVRGSDYAVHNRDCVRFCDAVEAGVTPNPGVNCVSRRCHQVTYSSGSPALNVAPNPPSNCELLPCNLLTPDELNDNKFGDSNTVGYKYCDNTLKCFQFTRQQLPYAIVNTTCKIHDCRVSCVDNATDDVSKIINKGSSYESDYERLINFNYTVGSASDQLCNPTTCKPIVQVPYRCSPQADSNPTIPNVSCDASGPGSTCSGGYCYATLDCNLAANTNSVYCITGNSGDSVGSTDDSAIHSWFYRPKPLDTAVEGNGAIKDFHTNSAFTPDGVGYYVSQMRGYGWGKEAIVSMSWLFGAKDIDMGYMHSSILGDGARSPGMYNVAKLAGRGTGLGYLCGMNINIYNKPYSDTAYHSGYVESTFTDVDATHKLTVCVRFDNTSALGYSCGQRECSVSCAFASADGKGCTQYCGGDVCRTLVVKDSDPYQCAMSTDISTGGDGSVVGSGHTSRDCMRTIDGYLRVRAVQYGDYICTFLDAKGVLAYPPNNDYFDGSEKVLNGTYCASGTINKNGGCDGSKNTNDTPGEADRWRTLMQVNYVQSNQAGGNPQGYLDKSGKLFPSHECAKVSHRVGPPLLPNLGNQSNAPRIFIPPLYILSVSTIRGGGLAPIPSGQTLGDTDFHYPEITATFGQNTQKLSLDFDKTGFEDPAVSDPNASATITTTINNTGGSASYSVEVFVRKEYNEASEKPVFCLYKKVQDSAGVYLNPQRVECVNRKYPEINNSADKAILPSLDFRKVVVESDATNVYNNSRISLRYLSSSTNNDTCLSGTASCSSAILLSGGLTESCSSSSEGYKVCAKRDYCSQLNIECINNEVDLHTAEITNAPIDSFLVIRNNCNQSILQYCNSLFGISSSATVADRDLSNSGGDPNAYGWFNEVCLTSGFENKLKDVVAYKMDSGVMGKCLIDNAKKNPSADCSAGGKAPDCPCVEYNINVALSASQTSRQETLHEAGLCIDMPLPQMCPTISHNPTPYTGNGGTDPDYVITSLDQTAYGTSQSQVSGVVHISHKYRTYGSASSPVIPVVGHAYFPQAIFGFNDVRGECRGFWRPAKNASGVEVLPTMSCLNSGGSATWGAVTNSCVRYSCPEVSTSGVDDAGNYQGGYGATETGENKGLSNGFANWLETQSDDFPVTSSATSCIAGFKKNGATTVMSGGETNPAHAALYSRITGYSGGTSATRQCNQVGGWETPSVSCERIKCPPINLDTATETTITNVPTSSSDGANWELWRNSGGAYFHSVNAARSSILNEGSAVKAAATVSGTCNNSLGYFQIGGTAPTRVCDSLGNWGEVQNPCVTQCDQVDCISYPDTCQANQSAHGYATWSQVTGVPISGEKDGVFGACVGGSKVVYPYPALKDKYGNAYALGNCTTATCPANTIPINVNNDTRAITNPQRVCKSVTTSVAGSDVWASIWSGVSSECVDSCPGADSDPRINAGRTQHPVSENVTSANAAAGVLTVDWPKTTFGGTVYINSPGDISSHNGSQYYYNRTNGYYSLSRYCNPTTHKWDPPVVNCVTNGGQIKAGPDPILDSLATYNSPNLVSVGSQTGNGTCVTGSYSDSNGNTVASAATCSYTAGNSNIDQTYFDTGSAKKCNPMCKSKGGDTFGNAVNPAADTTNYVYYQAGSSKLNLNCKSGYGSTIMPGTSVNNSFHGCGRIGLGLNSDRSPNGPYVVCQDGLNGTASWSSTYNNCDSCRGCNSSSSLVTLPSDVGYGDADPDYSKTSANGIVATGYSSGHENCSAQTKNANIQNDLMDNCPSYLTLDNSGCVRMEFTASWSCHKCAGGCTQHTDLTANVRIMCVDGIFIPSTDCSYTSNPHCKSF